MQGAWVPSLVRELRSHMPYSLAKRFKKKKGKKTLMQISVASDKKLSAQEPTELFLTQRC